MSIEPTETDTLFAALGGHETFARLVARFYQGVRTDEHLAPMYPQDDWEGSEERLRLFLEQYWGGPTTYSDTRGHPRLRMRHVRFAVTPDARDRWLTHMRVALDELDLAPEAEHLLWDYLIRAADSMVNTPETSRTPLI
ncbi:globin [Georgenia yuyongxinii]|uniref:globin n=1 Tax=Georgenia yuyongxinii TaxID=2589797 RepID=UPI002ED83BA6